MVQEVRVNVRTRGRGGLPQVLICGGKGGTEDLEGGEMRERGGRGWLEAGGWRLEAGDRRIEREEMGGRSTLAANQSEIQETK